MRDIKKQKDGTLIVDGVLYTPCDSSALPASLGFKVSQSNAVDQQWFNYKGITYTIKI